MKPLNAVSVVFERSSEVFGRPGLWVYWVDLLGGREAKSDLEFQSVTCFSMNRHGASRSEWRSKDATLQDASRPYRKDRYALPERLDVKTRKRHRS